MCFLQTFCVLESKHHAFCRLREVFAPSVLAGRALRAAYCRFLLASLQLAHIFPEVQRPKADAVLQLRSCQFPGERKDFSLCLGSVYDPVQCVFSFSPAEQRRAACSAPGPRTPPLPPLHLPHPSHPSPALGTPEPPALHAGPRCPARISDLRKLFGARPCLLGSPFLRVSYGCSGPPAPRRGWEPCWMRATPVLPVFKPILGYGPSASACSVAFSSRLRSLGVLQSEPLPERRHMTSAASPPRTRPAALLQDEIRLV